MKPLRIALYGNFGSGNLGNECTLQAALERIWQQWPDASLTCICAVPDDVESRHKIRGFRSTAGGMNWSWKTSQATPEQQRARALGGYCPGGKGIPQRLKLRVIEAVRRHRALRFPAKIVRWGVRRMPRELMHWVRSLRLMSGMDVLIVPGTGILTDDRCGPFVWPYEVFKYSALAALCRVRLVFLSVGAGPIHHALSRWFFRRSLGFACYRSYRDDASRRYVAGIGFDVSGDPIRPDLVFGLTRSHLPAPSVREKAALVVGLGLKDYSDAKGGGYQSYLATMASFVVWLGSEGHRVKLIIGDLQYDARVWRDLMAMMTGLDIEQTLVPSEPAPTVEGLLLQLGGTDIVVSPRLHNLILALMLNKPVIALSDLPKIDALLDEFGMPQNCLQMRTLSSENLISHFQNVRDECDQLQTWIRDRVDKYRSAVDEQYAAISETVSAAAL
jgi:polysaccharide pyruvyl transferase WcaK-like protein